LDNIFSFFSECFVFDAAAATMETKWILLAIVGLSILVLSHQQGKDSFILNDGMKLNLEQSL